MRATANTCDRTAKGISCFKVVAIIHGGGYIVGSSSDVHQSAEPLAGVGDVIVVSFNYRLGIFGFADMKEIAPGNLGLHDQRLALRWIRDHISDFGGDPKQVTVMGVSAGSMAVSAQIITIADKEDLFQAAVLDAGVVASHGFLEESESSFVRTQRVAEAVGCSKDSDKILECLRNIPAGALLSNSTTHPGSSALKNFRPTADGVFLPRDVERYVAEGSENLRKVRTIVGHAANEGTMFVNLVDPTFDFSTQRSKDDILDYCKKISIAYNFPFDASKEDTREKLERLYVDDNAGTAFKAISSLIADGWFKCPINTFIRDYSRHNSKVFAYRFVRELRKTYATFDPKILGAFHYSPYLHFSGALFMANDTVDGADKQFSLDAMKLISDFAASNRALVFRGVEWQNYLESGEVLIFNETPEVAKELSSERNCEELFPDRH